MEDKLARLERLARLKEAGALSKAEFEAEKLRLLEAPAPAPPTGRTVPLLAAGGIAIAAAAAIAVYFAFRGPAPEGNAFSREAAPAATAAHPGRPATPAAPPARPDRPQPDDLLDNPTVGAAYFSGWIYDGGGLFGSDLSAHVVFFHKRRQLLLALADPVRRNARGGIVASRVRETLILTLGPGEEYTLSCYLDGRQVVTSIHDRTDSNVRAVFTDGRRFILGDWLPAARYDGCEVNVD